MKNVLDLDVFEMKILYEILTVYIFNCSYLGNGFLNHEQRHWKSVWYLRLV